MSSPSGAPIWIWCSPAWLLSSRLSCHPKAILNGTLARNTNSAPKPFSTTLPSTRSFGRPTRRSWKSFSSLSTTTDQNRTEPVETRPQISSIKDYYSLYLLSAASSYRPTRTLPILLNAKTNKNDGLHLHSLLQPFQLPSNIEHWDRLRFFFLKLFFIKLRHFESSVIIKLSYSDTETQTWKTFVLFPFRKLKFYLITSQPASYLPLSTHSIQYFIGCLIYFSSFFF